MEDERGVSVVLGAALFFGIIIAFVAAFLATWMPGQVGQHEHTQMLGVGDSFRQLRNTIANIQEGEFRSVDVDMSANYSIPLVPSSKQVGTLAVTPAPVIMVRIFPANGDAYIDNNLPTTNFGVSENLLVDNWGTAAASKITFLKFSLDNGNIPRSAAILTANLWLYCNRFTSYPTFTPAVETRKVDNDNWKEDTITWNNAPRDNIGYILDNHTVGKIGWFSWTVKDFVSIKTPGDNRSLTLGLIVERNQDNTVITSFYSNNYTNDNYRPYLEIKYTSGPPIWKQTNWDNGKTFSALDSNAGSDNYNKYYTGENENTKIPGEIILDNQILIANTWIENTQADFESDNTPPGSLENLDTKSFSGNVVLAGDNIILGYLGNLSNSHSPYMDHVYIQKGDNNEYAAPSNGVITQWKENFKYSSSATGMKLKIGRYVSGTVWTIVGESAPVNITSGGVKGPFSTYIPVRAGDRLGVYTGTGSIGALSYSWFPSLYIPTRTAGDIPVYATASFTNKITVFPRLPIQATLLVYKYSGTLTSKVKDTIDPETNWRTISWSETIQPDTNITLQTRTGNTPIPDSTWTDWSNPCINPAGEQITSLRARYIQYRVDFSTTDTAHTPSLDWVKITFLTSPQYTRSDNIESSVFNAGYPVDWRDITWDAETPTLPGENKTVDNQPITLIDWSPQIGENLLPLQNVLILDNVYESIRENLRSPWWDRSWAFRNPVTINNIGNPNSLQNYQVKIDVNYDSSMFPNFGDLRFVDNDNVTMLSYWIENYTPSAKATVWVKIPNIPANANITIYMFYGNPGAIPGSDFDATFPNSLIVDNTAKIIGGVQKIDWVEIRNHGYLVVQSGNPLQLSSRKITVDSTSFIYATGSGYLGGGTNLTNHFENDGLSYTGTSGGKGGYAASGGSNSDGPGGGGGAYAGVGGNGGGARGSDDYPGAGATVTFGSDNDNSLYMGSGGGSGGLSDYLTGDEWNAGGAGGSGGGIVLLNAGTISIYGKALADGGNGSSGFCDTGGSSGPGTGGGGGGSGGTILIQVKNFILKGTLSASGGTGGARSPVSEGGGTAGGAGGGGGGGRIKVYWDNSFDNTAAIENVAGGANGGASYEAPVAQAGTSGTITVGSISYKEPTTSVGAKELESANRGQQGYYLNWEHRITGISSGYGNYLLHVWGYSSGDEPIGVYVWDSKTNNWNLIGNLPTVPGTEITFSILQRNLADYLVGDNLSIGYFDTAGDATPTIIYIDYVSFECIGGPFPTSVKVLTRTGNTPNPYTDNTGSWSDWAPAENNGPVPSPNSTQYIQYCIIENTTNSKITPVFKEIEIDYRLKSEYGTVGFSQGNVFYPDQAYVFEESTVFLSQSNVNLSVLDPLMIRVVKSDDNIENVYVNLGIIENTNGPPTLTSTGTRTIRVYCLNNTQTIIPIGGPNRDNVVIRALSPYTDVWSEYLSSKSQMLNSMGVVSTFDPNTLTLTILGSPNKPPGVKDINYFENVKELEVDLI